MATWNITNCKYTDAVSGVTDKEKIIIGAFYKVTSDKGATTEGYADIHASNFDNWKEWNTVTESEVVDWVKTALGEDKVTEIENKVNGMGGFGIPWA